MAENESKFSSFVGNVQSFDPITISGIVIAGGILIYIIFKFSKNKMAQKAGEDKEKTTEAAEQKTTSEGKEPGILDSIGNLFSPSEPPSPEKIQESMEKSTEAQLKKTLTGKLNSILHHAEKIHAVKYTNNELSDVPNQLQGTMTQAQEAHVVLNRVGAQVERMLRIYNDIKQRVTTILAEESKKHIPEYQQSSAQTIFQNLKEIQIGLKSDINPEKLENYSKTVAQLSADLRQIKNKPETETPTEE